MSSRTTRINFWHALVSVVDVVRFLIILHFLPNSLILNSLFQFQIPDKLKNLGTGDRLANAALDYAMERQMKIRLTHPFLR